MTSRIKRAERIVGNFGKEGIDSLLVTRPANIFYLSGFRSSDAALFITKNKRFLITDSRYELEAKKNIKGFNIEIVDGSFFDLIRNLVKSVKVRRLGFEYRYLSYGEHAEIKKRLTGVELVPVIKMVEDSRVIKDPEEIALIKAAVLILKNAVTYFKSILKPGLSEIDLAVQMEYFIMAASGERSSFEIIVASGSNSAFPHARPTKRVIKPNDMVLLDLGVNYDGYNSDLTRMFFLGKINHKSEKLYDIVKEAQRRSIKAIRPGAKISRIDSIARDFIRKKGFGDNFGHALGHGIGLEVHEAPAVSSKNHAELKPGMVFTIEPAVYLSERGGIRIEDMVLVTRKGCEILTDDFDK